MNRIDCIEGCSGWCWRVSEVLNFYDLKALVNYREAHTRFNWIAEGFMGLGGYPSDFIVLNHQSRQTNNIIVMS